MATRSKKKNKPAHFIHATEQNKWTIQDYVVLTTTVMSDVSTNVYTLASSLHEYNDYYGIENSIQRNIVKWA